MSYKSILINLDIDRPIAAGVAAAVDLARRHDAKLIGFCAADAALPMAGIEGGALAAEVWQQMRDDIAQRFKEVRAEFERLTADFGKTEWREALTAPTQALIEASRSADLILVAAADGASPGNTYRVADPANVVLQAGRPLLILSGKAEKVQARKIVVAWKDAREARRAVADAIPLLVSAEEVTVVTVTPQADQWIQQSVMDVVAFLVAHGVKARPELIESPDDYLELSRFMDRSGADLVVSGAYGHSRLREWAFGGVTRSLLGESARNRFMSS